MKNKIMIIILAVICSLTFVIGLTACSNRNDNPPAHVHGYAWTDNGDGTHSGHCSVSGCDKPDINNESHVWGSDDKCTKCKAAKPSGTEDSTDHSHVWAPGWTNNETHHWHECTAKDCTLTDNSKKGGYGAHNTSGIGGVCSVCGYKPSGTEDPPTPSVIEAQSVTIGQTSLSLDKNATATLMATVLPTNTTDKSVTWQSDKPNIAKVDSNGKVTAVAIGTAIITVSTKNEKSASCTVIVNESTDYEFTSYRNGYAVTAYNGSAKKIVVPAIYNNKSVIAIGTGNDDGLGYCAFETVDLPISLREINAGAFENCADLQSINIPSCTSIKSQAFAGCAKLTELVLPDTCIGIESQIVKNCVALHKLVLPTMEFVLADYFGVSSGSLIPSALKEVEITGGAAIPQDGFKDCVSLTDITIPNTVVSLPTGVFRGCIGLQNISLPFVGANRNTSNTRPATADSWMGGSPYAFGYVFGGERRAFARYTTPESTAEWTYQGASGFYDNSVYQYQYDGYFIPQGLKTVKITDANAISGYAFYNCKLTSAELSDAISSIERNAFYGCISLTSITIPNSVTSIGDYAFYGCGGLSNITVASGNTKYHSAGNCLIETDSKKIILGCKDSVIPVDEGVTEIGEHAFAYCDGLTNITIPNSITKIGMGAFYDCDSLANITIPFVGASLDGTSNTHFGYIFGASSYSSNSSCVPLSLKTVIITGGTSIGSNAFYNCTRLASITIPDSATDIAGGALYGCSSLKILSFPYVWSSRAFGYLFGISDYSGATAVVQYELTNPNTNSGSEYTYYIPSSLKKVIVAKGNIPYGAFRACRMIESIEFPQTESIGTGAFFQCSNLKNIYIPSSINKIGDYVFRECEKIESITVAEDNTVYHSSGNCLISTNSKSMLLGCKNSIIPNDGSVTSIYDAFYGCKGLTNIIIPNSVTSIGKYAFLGCDNLEGMTLPFAGARKDGTSDTHFGYIFGADKYSNNSQYVPSSLKTIILTDAVSVKNNTFRGCSRISSITIPSGVTSIGYQAFYGCTSLWEIAYTGDISKWCAIPNLGELMEYGSTVKTLTIDGKEISGVLAIPDGVTSIGDYAFYGCSKLTSIKIPNSVTSIGDRAFQGCSGLTSITIPDSVTSIGYDVFYGCSKLTIYCQADSKPANWSTDWGREWNIYERTTYAYGTNRCCKVVWGVK